MKQKPTGHRGEEAVEDITETKNLAVSERSFGVAVSHQQTTRETAADRLGYNALSRYEPLRKNQPISRPPYTLYNHNCDLSEICPENAKGNQTAILFAQVRWLSYRGLW